MQLHVFVLHSYTLLPFLKDNVSFFKMMSLFKEEMPFFLKQNQQDISYYYCNNAGRASPTYSYYQHIILVLILPMYVLSFKCKLLDASMPNCMARAGYYCRTVWLCFWYDSSWFLQCSSCELVMFAADDRLFLFICSTVDCRMSFIQFSSCWPTPLHSRVVAQFHPSFTQHTGKLWAVTSDLPSSMRLFAPTMVANLISDLAR